MAQTPKITIGKLDAARRQLQTAIELWFDGGDPVAIHTLAYAAYEIIHAVSKKRNPSRRDLLFDSDMIKQERRIEVVKALKKAGNFFKHANTDGDSVLEFKPALSELFIMFSIIGVQTCGERLNLRESVLVAWFSIHNHDALTAAGEQFIAQNVPIEQIDYMRSLSKRDFFEQATQAGVNVQRSS